jgi:hypothetical protein
MSMDVFFLRRDYVSLHVNEMSGISDWTKKFVFTNA